MGWFGVSVPLRTQGLQSLGLGWAYRRRLGGAARALLTVSSRDFREGPERAKERRLRIASLLLAVAALDFLDGRHHFGDQLRRMGMSLWPPSIFCAAGADDSGFAFQAKAGGADTIDSRRSFWTAGNRPRPDR